MAPLAAARSADVAFVIIAGAMGTTPAQQQAWSNGEFLRHAGVRGSMLRTMEVTGMRLAVGTGLFGEVDYDPVPAWERVRQPVLAVWGELDREAMPAESSRIIRDALERGGNPHSTIRFIPGVRHNLNRTFNGGFDRPASLTPDYGALEASWIHALADGPPAASAQPAPHQERQSRPLAPLAWYESPWLQLGALTVFLAAFLIAPLAAALRRTRRRHRGGSGRAPAQQAARWLAATGLAAVLGFVAYFGFMTATANNLVGPVLFGQPLPWLLLRILATAAVVAAAATAVLWWRDRHHITGGARFRLALALAAGVLLVPWTAYWGLLT